MSAVSFAKVGGALQVKFSACTREPLSWKEELYAAARAIASKTSKPLWLCSSGGIDSEVMCHAFYDQGINFTVLTLRHTAGTNEHDTSFARTWCRTYGVPQKVFNIDFMHFMQTDVDAYIKQGYVSYHLFRYVQIRLMEIVEGLGGFAVLGGGEQYYQIDPMKTALTRDDIFLEFDLDYGVAHEWMRRNTAAHEPFFFFSTSELCLSYLRIPLVEFALTHPDILRHPVSTYTLKRLVYQSVWLKQASRPKYNGFENFGPQVEILKERVRREFPDEIRSCRLPIPVFEAQLDIALRAERGITPRWSRQPPESSHEASF